MQIPSALACPHCRSGSLAVRDPGITCVGCDRTFPVVMGIFDFRDVERDKTADFSIAEDRRLAEKMAVAFEKTTTFNEMIAVYEALRDRSIHGADIDAVDVDRLIEEEKIRPMPLRQDQLVHGRAILEKIRLHLDALGCEMPNSSLALENGCGLGFFVEGLATYFNHLLVLDFSLCYLILAKKIMDERHIDNATLICGSVEHLPVQNDVVDFIHSNNVVEHVSNQKAMFAEAKRILSCDGILFVISPNRFSLYFEPHFRLPGFGFIPKPLRRKIIQTTQNRDIDDISLLSLGELRTHLAEQFGRNIYITFIPRRLKSTVMGGAIRTFLVRSLNSRFLGDATDFLFNKVFLGVMPYHVAFCFKKSKIA